MNTPVNFEIDKLLIEKGIDMPVSTTIAEVVMWLYKKHGIWVIVSHEISDLHQTEWFWIGVKNGEETASQYFGFNTPTEAYEAAIEYTLKNLI